MEMQGDINEQKAPFPTVLTLEPHELLPDPAVIWLVPLNDS